MASTVAQQQPVTHEECVALGVPAKIVMIVDNENFRLRTSVLAEKISRRQPANSSPHDDKIVFFSRRLRLALAFPKIPIAQLVSVGVGALMVATHALSLWRIVARILLGRGTCGFINPGKQARRGNNPPPPRPAHQEA